MKQRIMALCLLAIGPIATAQNGLAEILSAGIGVATEFTNSYSKPAAEAFAYNLSAGWYDDARVLPKGKFNLILRGQTTFAPDGSKSFLLDPDDYEKIIQNAYNDSANPPADVEVSFGDGGTSPRMIATALGKNEIDQFLNVVYYDVNNGDEVSRFSIQLPQGIGDAGLDAVPSAFLQAGYGLGSGLEIKARLVPRVQIDEARITVLGAAVQWQLTDLFDKQDKLPLDVSVLAGYSVLDALYDFEDGNVIDGVDQELETKSGSLTLSLVGGTDFKVLNFYAGVNYNAGTVESDLLGTYYAATTGRFIVQQTFEDPISVKTDVSSMLGTVGSKITLGFFQMNVGYTFGPFDTLNGAIAFKF